MDAKTFDKSKLPSRHETERPSRAPHRSYDYAMGLTHKQVHKPFALSAMVGLAGCDKSLSGAMKSMLRLNMPAVHMYGGSIPPGKLKGRDVTVLDVFENGDIICIEAEKGTLDLEVSETEFAKRPKAWQSPASLYQSGALRKHADQVGRRARVRSRMPAERRKWSAMRKSSGLIAAALVAWAGVASAQQATTVLPTAQYASAQSALERGLGAFRTGKQDVAISALGSAAAMSDASARFIAEFYLARIYGENATPATNHTKAYVLYRKLADENLDIDPHTSQRAPFVAKALLALAGYVRAGVKEIDLAPNPRRAADYLHHAGVYFGDRDARLELAKTYLTPDSSSDDMRRGLHHLAVLAEESHGPAQAVLADLFWRGRHVSKDDRRALALATMAAENAPQHERIWIEEGYAAIFCTTTQITRAEAGVLVARWRQTFLRPTGGNVARTGSFELLPERQCASGERVALGPAQVPASAAASKAAAAPASSAAAALPMAVGTLKTAPAPVGFKAAGIIDTTAKK